MLRTAKPKKFNSAATTKTKKTSSSPSTRRRHRRSPSQSIKSRQLHTSRTAAAAPVPFTSTSTFTPTSFSNGFAFNTKSSIKSIKSPITLMTQGHHRTIMTNNSLTTLFSKTRGVMKVLPTTPLQKKHQIFLAPSSPLFRSFSSTTGTSDDKVWDFKSLCRSKKVRDQDSEAHSKLKTFWSTSTPERDTKFKQIILQREIGREDFQAILSNSFRAEKTRDSGYGGDMDTSFSVKHILFPWHLTLTSYRREMGSEHNGIIESIGIGYCTGEDVGADKESLSFGNAHWWGMTRTGFGSGNYFKGSDPITALGRKLITHNPSPIPKLAIASITADNIDLIDGLFDKVNIYDLVPKGKMLSYFLTNPDLDRMFEGLDLMESYDLDSFNIGLAAYVGDIIKPKFEYSGEDPDTFMEGLKDEGKKATFLKYFDPERNRFRWDVWDENSPDYTPAPAKDFESW